MTLVSVIISTYNRTDLISETISSILNQIYSNLEVIVVSDGHQDSMTHLIEDFGDDRLKYFEVSHSGRPAIPRNFGMKRALGEYIAFCDDDDMWLPDKLMRQVEYLNQHPDIGLVFCAFRTKSPESEYNNRIIGPKTKTILSGYIYDRLLNYNFIVSSSVMARASFFDSIGNFDEDPNMAAAEDWDLWLRIARKHKIAFIPEVSGIYRMHNYNFSMDGRRLQRAFYVIDKHLKNGWVTQKQANMARVNFYFRIGWSCIDKNTKLSRSLFYNAIYLNKGNIKLYCLSIIGLFLSIFPFIYSFIKKQSLDKKLGYCLMDIHNL